MQHLFIRATEAADTTIAMLHGISLDVARPSAPGAPRQALGVEQCTCPPQYGKYFLGVKTYLRTVNNENMFAGGTSCQDPGRGYYRWYKEAYVESEIIIDLVGDSKKVSPHWSAAGHVTPVLTSYWPV